MVGNERTGVDLHLVAVSVVNHVKGIIKMATTARIAAVDRLEKDLDLGIVQTGVTAVASASIVIITAAINTAKFKGLDTRRGKY